MRKDPARCLLEKRLRNRCPCAHPRTEPLVQFIRRCEVSKHPPDLSLVIVTSNVLSFCGSGINGVATCVGQLSRIRRRFWNASAAAPANKSAPTKIHITVDARMRLLSLVTNLPTNRSPASRLYNPNSFRSRRPRMAALAALRHRRMSAFYCNLRQKPTRIDNRASNDCRAQAAGVTECRGGLAALWRAWLFKPGSLTQSWRLSTLRAPCERNRRR